MASCASCPEDPCAPLPAPSALEKHAEELLCAGRPAEARALFFQAMRGQDRPFLSWIGVARASVALGDCPTADTAVGQAMQLNPGSAAATDLVGRTVLMIAQERGQAGRGQALMADAILSRAERIAPDTPKIAYHRGLAHLVANDPRRAIGFLERAARSDPSDASARQALAVARERAGVRVAPAAE
jgi:predicted Zn-dependent protease